MHVQIWPNFIDHPTPQELLDEERKARTGKVEQTCMQCGSPLAETLDDQPTECTSCCQLCGEPADGESTEYTEDGVSKPGHYQCIIDAGMDPA